MSKDIEIMSYEWRYSTKKSLVWLLLDQCIDPLSETPIEHGTIANTPIWCWLGVYLKKENNIFNNLERGFEHLN
jgi:hypothetical protein